MTHSEMQQEAEAFLATGIGMLCRGAREGGGVRMGLSYVVQARRLFAECRKIRLHAGKWRRRNSGTWERLPGPTPP